jgi:rhomboid protease GluP
MNPLPIIFKRVILPLYIITLLFLLLYTCLHWLLFIYTGIFKMDEKQLTYAVPVVLSLAVAYSCMRSRIRLLDLKETRRGNGESIIILLTAAIVAVPAMIAQPYMVSATGKLTALKDVRDITKTSPTRYYTLADYYADKAHTGFYRTSYRFGRYQTREECQAYFAVPVFPGAEDTVQPAGAVWVGVLYQQEVGHMEDALQKQRERNDFYRNSRADFSSRDLHQFKYFRSVSDSHDGQGYLMAEKQSDKALDSGSVIVLEGSDQPFSERNGYRLLWVFAALTSGFILWFLWAFKKSLKPDPRSLLYPQLNI